MNDDNRVMTSVNQQLSDNQDSVSEARLKPSRQKRRFAKAVLPLLALAAPMVGNASVRNASYSMRSGGKFAQKAIVAVMDKHHAPSLNELSFGETTQQVTQKTVASETNARSPFSAFGQVSIKRAQKVEVDNKALVQVLDLSMLAGITEEKTSTISGDVAGYTSRKSFNSPGFEHFGANASHPYSYCLGPGDDHKAGYTTEVSCTQHTTGYVWVPALVMPVPDLDAASDTGIDSEDNETVDKTPTFSGTIIAGSTVTLTSSVDGVVGSTTADGVTGAWSITASTLADGPHNMTVTAEYGGGISAPSAALTVTINTDLTLDTDGDGLPDFFEVEQGTDFNDAVIADSDDDGISDDLEQFIALVFNKVLEDSASVGGSNNADGIATTFVELDLITDLESVFADNEMQYQQAIQAATDLSTPPTLEELQALVNQVNSDVILLELLEDSLSVGGSGNANSTAVDVEALLRIIDIEDVLTLYESDYQASIAAEESFSNPVTLTEVQALINDVNTAAGLRAVLEDSASVGGASNIDGVVITAEQLSAITGLIDVSEVSEAAYQAAIAAETNFSNPPTVAQLQTVIDNVNSPFDDADGDGIPDSVEIGLDANNPTDSDGDGTPDFQDIDSDGDGTLDSDEIGGDPFDLADEDGDGIPDYVDIASGENGGDSDGDGISDSEECPDYPNCADTDKDSTPDYLEPDSDGDGVIDGRDPSINVGDDVKKGSFGLGVSSAGLCLLVMFAMVLRARKIGLLLALCSAGFTQAGQWEVNAGTGFSMYDVELADGLEISKKNDHLWQLGVGYFFTPDWQIELRYIDLGEVEINDTAEVEYQTVSLNAKYVLPVDNEYLSFYVLAGVHSLDVSGNPGLNLAEENDVNIHWGVGAVKALSSDYFMNVEYSSYTNDLGAFSLSVNKRF